jgi:hypothetical protein
VGNVAIFTLKMPIALSQPVDKLKTEIDIRVEAGDTAWGGSTPLRRTFLLCSPLRQCKRLLDCPASGELN